MSGCCIQFDREFDLGELGCCSSKATGEACERHDLAIREYESTEIDPSLDSDVIVSPRSVIWIQDHTCIGSISLHMLSEL